MSLSKELLCISTSTNMFSDHRDFLHELEEKETKYCPSKLPRHRVNDRQNNSNWTNIVGRKPAMRVWFRSFVTVGCRCLQQNLEAYVSLFIVAFTFVRRVTAEGERGEGRGGAGGKRRLEREDEGPRFGAELGDHLKEEKT